MAVHAEDMRLYAIVLIITWAAIVTASSESNVSSSSDEKAVDHAESRDSPARRIAARPYVTSIEARSSGQTGTEDHSNDVANAGLSGSAAVRSGERGSNDATATTGSSSTAPLYVTPSTGTASDARPYGELLDLRESGYTVPEDVLLVENAGSFGQRVRQGHLAEASWKAARKTDDRRRGDDDYGSYRKSFSSTVSFLEDRGGDDGRPHASTTRKPVVLKEKQDSANDSPFSEPRAIGSERAFARNLDQVPGATSTTQVRPLDGKHVASRRENEYESLPQPQAPRSSQRYNGTADASRKTIPEIIPENAESVVRTSTSVEVGPSLRLGGFSGPIVVADLPADEAIGIRDAVPDYMDDENLEPASGIKSFSGNLYERTNPEIDAGGSKTAASNDIAISSIMLKPLQVGIALMNADEAASDADYLRNDLPRLAVADKSVYKANHSRIGYKDAEGLQSDEERPAETVTRKVLDNSVEIQKSIELFHTAPVHEIHYPVEYIRQTTNMGVIETNSIANGQSRWKQSHAQQDQRSESNYDVYQGNDQLEKNVIKAHASTLSERYNRHDYNDPGVPESKLTTASLRIADYSTASTREQTPAPEIDPQSIRYSTVQPVLLIPAQSGDASRHQSDQRRNLNSDNDVPLGGSSASQEVANKYVKTYIPDTYRTQQPYSPTETRRPETQQLLLKIVPNESTGEGGFLVPLPRPYSIEKIVEKTVHVPHPVEVEKVIEKTVPFPVERVVERQVPVQVPVPVPVPQPYPVHLQVVPDRQIRVQPLYPVQIERRAPYTLVQRPLPQSVAYPLHTRVPGYPQATHTSTEKAAEKPVATARPSRPYRVDVERQPSIDGGSADVTFDKYRQKGNVESILENVVPRGTGEPSARPSEVNIFGHHRGDPGYAVGRPLTAFNYVSAPRYPDVRLMLLPRGYSGQASMTSRPQVVSSLYAVPVSLRRQIAYNLVEKEPTKGDEYIGPAPVSHKGVPRGRTRSPQHPASLVAQSQHTATTSGVLRKSRQPETRYPGSFRQSKMEYGFKPPMVPSVQYDENTATKVAN